MPGRPAGEPFPSFPTRAGNKVHEIFPFPIGICHHFQHQQYIAALLLKMMIMPGRERNTVNRSVLLPSPVLKAETVPRSGARVSERTPTQPATPCRPQLWPRGQYAEHTTLPRSTIGATRSPVSQPNRCDTPCHPEASPC